MLPRLAQVTRAYRDFVAARPQAAHVWAWLIALAPVTIGLALWGLDTAFIGHLPEKLAALGFFLLALGSVLLPIWAAPADLEETH